MSSYRMRLPPGRTDKRRYEIVDSSRGSPMSSVAENERPEVVRPIILANA